VGELAENLERAASLMKRNSLTQGFSKVGLVLFIVVLVAVMGIEEYRIHKLNQPTVPSTVPCEEGVGAGFEDDHLYKIYGRDIQDMLDSISLSQIKFGYVIGISGGNLVIEDGKVVENPIPMCPELKEAESQHTQFDYMEKFNELKVYSSEEYHQIIRKQRVTE